MAKSEHRGSRRHVLDWVVSPDFLLQLNTMLAPTGAHVDKSDKRMPRGGKDEAEARLERFGPAVLPEIDWKEVRDWWLAHHRGANTPNWDLAAGCTIDGRRGLVLVEAKANANEVKREGKLLLSRKQDKDGQAQILEPSPNSKENHARISMAIEQARAELEQLIPGWGISIGTHYQLSNRVAFAWRLASFGVPTVLVYLGFLGDDGIRNVGLPFRSAGEWETCVADYMKDIVPAGAIGRPIDCGAASFWILVRSLPVLSQSPPPLRR